ncbi:MAG: radical SAM protein [Deltaproteobacteria bacterium]|nr:radical SAM protein [Deltaproteobacteria bacterium]
MTEPNATSTTRQTARDKLPARALGPTSRNSEGPAYCVWELTLRCDLGCQHCGSRAGRARADELRTDECLDVVRQLAEAGVREVTLIGGEAYLRDDWQQIAAAIVRSGMVCNMTTGARNLTDERVQQAVDAGMRSVSISLDGIGATHDAQRGSRGSYDAAMAACARVAASSLVLTNNSQINRLSLPELPAMARALASVGSRAWQIQLTVPMGNAADRPAVLLQPFELRTLFPLLVWIDETLLAPADILLAAGNNVGYFGPYESKLRLGGRRGAHWNGCSAGRRTIALEADGTVKSCPSLNRDDYGGGSVRERSLADALTQAPMQRLQRRTPADLWGFCQGCYYAETCLAGCSWTSHVLLGRPGNNPYCIHRAMDHDRRGLRERLVPVRAAPGVPFDNGVFAIEVEPVSAGSDTADGTILGLPREQVLGWRPDQGSIHDPTTLTHVLQLGALVQPGLRRQAINTPKR